MCHGQIVGSALVAAQRPYTCGVCERPIPKGQEHVRHRIEDLGDERKDGAPRTSVWRLHARCAVRWDAFWAEQSHFDDCVVDPMGAIREEARGCGWRAWRQAMRGAAERVLGLRRVRGEQTSSS
jgi:hypothetical protein